MSNPLGGRQIPHSLHIPDTAHPGNMPQAPQASAVPDLAERRRALDPARSFIVQAPAGSGKTGLLIQRYLKLLTCVDDPEEIVAITFTRKAAGEMRERVTKALARARESARAARPQTEHERTTIELASAAAARDARAGWHLAENPARLRIMTFDSLCASLSRQMPVLSGFGHQPEIVEDASRLYLLAASATIDLIETDGSASSEVRRLLEHLDNDVPRVRSLFAGMLARRDHWLRHIHGRDRDELEAALRRIRRDALKGLRELIELHPPFVHEELLDLLRYSARNLAASGKNGGGLNHEQLSELDGLPGHEEKDFDAWCAIAGLLLSKEGTWRKQHTVNDGFPALTKGRKDTAKEWKERACNLIQALATGDARDLLRLALHDVRQLPPQSYSDNQWEVLDAIIRLLPHAVAQLRLVFQSHNKVDFSEMAQGALRALGDPDLPTDLALALDYQVRHLLIDEFQDTSISQYELIERLTAGWEPGDGRSILAVGDPMQSIYRFREAEVGLFLRVRTTGIGSIRLQPVSLSANFRSQRGIVEWVNNTFARILPQHEDVTLGATPYTPSVGMHEALDGVAVTMHPFFNDDHLAEALRVTEIVKRVKSDDPSGSVAVLVRNRSHLHEIAPALRDAGLRFRAIDIEGLAFRPVVQDLLALTRALIHIGDRIAWLAVLRAPWCGLTLGDIHALVAGGGEISAPTSAVAADGGPAAKNTVANDRTVWEWLNDDLRLAVISHDGRARLSRLRDVLKSCIDNRCRQSLRDTVEAAWLALGGPACVDSGGDLGDAEAYLDYLEARENSGEMEMDALEEGLARLYALPDLSTDGLLQVMTIHKAKGLEFDTVILPGLGRSPRNEARKLFMWMENLRDSSRMDEMSRGDELLLAPIQETGGEPDRIYDWLEKLNGEKARFEDGRLLYVAATRARKRLHLLGSTGLNVSPEGRHELKDPARKSLLEKIWAVAESVYEDSCRSVSLSSHAGSKELGDSAIDQSLRRLAPDWTFPEPPGTVRWKAGVRANSTQVDIEYSWAGETARHIGNVVHRWLKIIAEDELEGWTIARIQALHSAFRNQLMAEGMDQNRDNELAAGRVAQALIRAVSDARGRWLLGAQNDAANELRMTAIIEGRRQDLVIDRTFYDASGQLWVVDYKTSSHEGADLEGFLNREQDRYRSQLDRYASLLRKNDQPVRRGLYFPLLGGWREWGDEI
jgi:ATP-dependent exoDNAse (exonuclease V) beta subunit